MASTDASKGGGVAENGRLAGLVWLLAPISLVVVVVALRSTAWISGTLALAFFATLAVLPVNDWIRLHVPHPLRWLGHAAALLLMLLVFILFTLGLLFVARRIATAIMRYQEALESLSDRIGQWVEIVGDQGGGEGSPIAQRLVEPVVSLATTVAQSLWSFGAILTLLFFLVWLMLLEAPAFAAKTSAMPSTLNGTRLRAIVEITAARFRRYLVVRTLLGVVTAILYMLWIWWWGLDFVLVWGLLAFLLNFIPTIGSIIAGALPVGLAFLQRDPATAIMIAAGLLVIEQVMGNYVDPKLQGRQLALSPLAVLVALMFWTWVWGLIGALLAVPMTLIITIGCAHLPALRPIALMLSSARNMDELEEATAP